jgi:glycosyltransferase involved in cell wall biosynthesis
MDNFYSKKLIHPWQLTPLISCTKCGQEAAVWTMVMPVYNQEKRLKDVLLKILKNSELNFNIIFIDDASDDNSMDVINEFVCDVVSSNTKKVIEISIIKNLVPIYETACDNQGFKEANTEYIIEIQSDIHIEEIGFDKRMIHAMETFNLGAVSGRHVHYFSMLEGRRAWFKYPWKLACWRIFKWGNGEGQGRLGSKVFNRIENIEEVCIIGETVARGPWLIKKSDLTKLSFLDEQHFFLGNDDHDYHRRLFEKLGKLVGYVPMDIHSISGDGSTRRPRIGINKKIYDFLKENKKGSEEFKTFLRKYRPYKKLNKNFI